MWFGVKKNRREDKSVRKNTEYGFELVCSCMSSPQPLTHTDVWIAKFNHRLYSFRHGIGKGSREPITFVYSNSRTPWCKNSNNVFTFVLADFRLADKRESKDRSTTVLTTRLTAPGVIVSNSVQCCTLQVCGVWPARQFKCTAKCPKCTIINEPLATET